jgi:hypothetical protein
MTSRSGQNSGAENSEVKQMKEAVSGKVKE